MADPLSVREWYGATVSVFATKQDLGEAAASHAAHVVRESVAARGRARIIVATGNSQLDFIQALAQETDVPWHAVEVFHMDEYLGMSADHPASFRRWVRERLVDRVHPAAAHYLDGSAPDPDSECTRYAGLLLEAPIDCAFVGIGENGHIAFNDPHTADFFDPNAVKVVTLDEACRRQQIGEGHFPSLDATPTSALTLTCPALMQAATLICCVPDERKARAVAAALKGPVTTQCPASLLRTHTGAFLYLDTASASLLSAGHDRPQQ